MATIKDIKVPDIGDSTDVDVIEILVAPGDKVEQEDSLITLEGDKATMEIPSPETGVVDKIHVNVGDKVSEGSLILSLKTEASVEKSVAEEKSAAVEKVAEKPVEKPAAKPVGPVEKEVLIPDIGDATDVDVIEVLVNTGDEVAKDDSLITLEGDKATMEIPAPYAGKIKDLKVKVGDKVSQGSLILIMDAVEEAGAAPAAAEKPVLAPTSVPAAKPAAAAPVVSAELPSFAGVHAGPAVRRIAREFGIDLTRVKGSGNKGRITKDDVKNFVKQALAGGGAAGLGLQVAPAPKVDFSKYGEIETKPLSKIKKLTGQNVHRSWVTVPHVTQFDEADITEMEAFRQAHKHEAEEKGFKLTPLVFIMKAVVASLQEFPEFNASLDASGENLIYKKYFHIGVAADTPNGLVVPVIRDVDQKGALQLAEELGAISKKAREKGLSMAEMSGGCFTISSLGGIGGTAFTPIVNTPDVAILGVSRSTMKPIWQKDKFEPRLMLPLSLSYDHRVIDGAAAARFISFLGKNIKGSECLLLS